MDRYLDIRILGDPEFNVSVLMNSVFGKLHLALVEMDAREIGVSFPAAPRNKINLGDRLRLHDRNYGLEQLMERNWLTGLRDYIRVGSIEPVEGNTHHCRVKRVQPKSNVQRLRRRYAKRHGVSEQEAADLIPDSVEQRLDLPFLQLKSKSTGRHFRLFIDQSEPQNEAVAGEFNTYGLSDSATVPWF